MLKSGWLESNWGGSASTGMSPSGRDMLRTSEVFAGTAR